MDGVKKRNVAKRGYQEVVPEEPEQTEEVELTERQIM